MNALGKIVSVTLPPDLRRDVQEFLSVGKFENVSEALRALLWRGLFIDQKPRGKWSDSAWFAAYQSMKLVLIQAAYQKFIVEGEFDRIAKEVFEEALRKSGVKLG